jgi:hypothetical protein
MFLVLWLLKRHIQVCVSQTQLFQLQLNFIWWLLWNYRVRWNLKFCKFWVGYALNSSSTHSLGLPFCHFAYSTFLNIGYFHVFLEMPLVPWNPPCPVFLYMSFREEKTLQHVVYPKWLICLCLKVGSGCEDLNGWHGRRGSFFLWILVHSSIQGIQEILHSFLCSVFFS